MITADGLGVTRDGRPALDGLSLRVDAGETLAVMGPNGAGKTTLLKAVAGLLEADSGRVEVDGVAGFAPEDPAAGLFAESVAEEVAFFPRNRGLDVDERRESAMAALDVADLADRDPHTLSVGQQRRVSIAAVLAGDPDVLVLDEPTRGLDGAGEAELAELLGELDCTILLATHAADFAWAAADRVAVLSDGECRRVGEARRVLGAIPFLESVGVRPPGIVRWARREGIDPPPADLQAALEALEAAA
ncbi:MAG: ABC transporter ATP-binding protein [Halobacteriales archaeon]|nr:ABC transporter ATP-binding protein [Halobacteriales archaeon]